ncbi:MAG: hypothetical protein R3A49_04390 [Acidimicrobiia bacterium]
MSIHRPFQDPTPESVRDFIDAVPLYAADVDDPTFFTDDRLVARRNELLRRQLGWLAEASPYYRKVFATEGVEVGDIGSTDDLVGLPVTTKQDLMGDPESFRLAFEQPGLYDLTYQTVYTTGTTTGLPTKYEYTTHDFFGVLQAGRRQNKLAYQVPGDRFFTAFPLSPLPHVSGFAGLIENAAGLGFFHGFGGMSYDEFPIHNPSDYIADQIELVQPQVVAGIGSFLRRMFADMARDGRDLSSIVGVNASGEVLTERMLDHMRENLAACGASPVFVSAPYGFTEGGLSFGQCREAGPLHGTAPDQIFMEVLDPDSGERLPDGERGLVTITHLNRRGMPLLRYQLGDQGVIRNSRCEACGRGGQSMIVSSGSAHITRTKEILKIKGTLVNPQVIHEVVMNTPGVLEYRMIVSHRDPGDPLSPDRLLIRIGIDEGDDVSSWNEGGSSTKQLEVAVKQATEVTPDVELVEDLSEIYDPTTEFKAQRILDERTFE